MKTAIITHGDYSEQSSRKRNFKLSLFGLGGEQNSPPEGFR